MTATTAIARFGNIVATDLLEVTHNPSDIERGGWWAITQTFEGEFTGFRFEQVRHDQLAAKASRSFNDWIDVSTWKSSMSQQQYEAAVETIRDDISRGWVYQANLCRMLHADVEVPIDLEALYESLLILNPAPHAGYLRIPEHNVDIASASPELFLSRNGDQLKSSPIKGTAKTSAELLEKDSAENIMIVDLVRNDLSHACIDGSVTVEHLLRLEEHPGLVHLVSDVTGRVTSDTKWSQILAATCPPGSVSGAPKSSALETISRLESGSRGYYCGAFGWINADEYQASLAVGIRTFWQERHEYGATLRFGTGAGITWESNPHGEWIETELKAHRLLNIVAGNVG